MTEASIIAALSDRSVLALTLWGEARNQPVEGRIAVASVIRTRVNPTWWGRSYREVCLKPQMFSVWNPGTDPNHIRLLALAGRIVSGEQSGDKIFDECLWIADGILNGVLLDRVAGANHYYAPNAMKPANKIPSWATNKTPVARVGDHLFFAI